ncbi:MAG: hypothetical protein ACOH1Y_00220 [Propionicimonas sp.]
MSIESPVEEAVPVGKAFVEFCGEWHEVSPDIAFGVGRDAELEVDSNPFLHRRLLEITCLNGIWLLSNVGARLPVTVMDAAGRMHSWLAPGGRLPLVFRLTTVVFSAGPTTYELGIHLTEPAFGEVGVVMTDGQTTIGVTDFTPSQKLLIVALAEPMLLREGSGMSDVPTNAKAADRLGWTLTRFNRKLDNVCDKLDRAGVKGLRGGLGDHAMNRRSRLVEYAIAARLVTRADLALLNQVREGR